MACGGCRKSRAKFKKMLAQGQEGTKESVEDTRGPVQKRIDARNARMARRNKAKAIRAQKENEGK